MKNTPFGVKLSGLGHAVPSKIVTNQDLEKIIETSSEWIETRTGIKQRHVCSSEEVKDTLFLSKEASLKALNGFPPSEVDLIIVATSTPDLLYPSTACRLQNALQAKECLAFDLSAACTGFVFALVTASQFLQLGTYKNALVVGVDIHSRFMDWTDRTTSILFGDAAGAVFLQSTDIQNNQLLSHSLHTNGDGGCDLTLGVGGSSFPNGKSPQENQTVSMNGKKIYHFAVKTIPESISESAELAGLKTNDIDYLICHQANQRILDSVAEKMGWPSEKCISNISKYGNTSAASIPLAWSEAAVNLKDNAIISLVGFGAGLTWGSAVWKWTK
jgi:3-oxoacyl-[acyl-carrier-protein] synthase-3